MTRRPALLLLAAGFLAAAFLAADGIERGLLLNTAWLVLLVEILTLPIAALLAFALARTNIAGKPLALLLCSSLLVVPLYLQLCGWEAAFGRQGWHTYFFNELKDPWLSSWRGAVAVHVAWSIPWATCLMAAAFAQGNREYEEAALLDAGPWPVCQSVTLPQLAGGLLMAALWIFVITAGEMTVTNIYMVPTYAEDVYNFYVGNGEARANLVHYFPLLLSTLSLVFALLALLPSPALTQPQAAYRWRLGNWQTLASSLVLFVLLALALFPIANLAQRLGDQVQNVDSQLTRGWSAVKGWQVLLATPQRVSGEAMNTAALGVSVTLLSLAVTLPCSWLARKRQSVTTLGWLLAAFGIALPGPIIGLAVIALLNHDSPLLDYLYNDTLVGPILAVTVRVAPLMFAALWWGMRTLDDEPLDAAALDGAGPLRKLFSIALPQRWPLVLAASLAALAIASGDVSASLLVLPPGPHETIARRMFGWIHVGADDQVAGVAILGWLAYLVVGGLIVLLVRRRNIRSGIRENSD